MPLRADMWRCAGHAVVQANAQAFSQATGGAALSQVGF